MTYPILGSYEMHVHASPDVTPRLETDLEITERWSAAHMGGGVLKCHYAPTAARAALMQTLHPELKIIGGIVLNRAVGGLNPEAVERCAQMGGQYVWFPTMDALSYQKHVHRNDPHADLSATIYLLDRWGGLLPEAKAVLRTAASHQMLVGTGHISAQEGMALVHYAAEEKLTCTIILTHADNPADLYTIDEQREAVQLGAMVEHCYFTTYYNRTSIESITEQIRAVGCDKVILSTDFGQPKSPGSVEGLAEYQQLLASQGFSNEELHLMFCDTPARLLSFRIKQGK
ncbi:MAG: DUF6282 family protein [Clostridiales bacterium]|nr:DUF6282 family protein [Clostridiales bacterium]